MVLQAMIVLLVVAGRGYIDILLRKQAERRKVRERTK
jgi:hypothetical protein